MNTYSEEDEKDYGDVPDMESFHYGMYKGSCIGVLTSGGDAPGMNAAIRAVVRIGLYWGCTIYYIYDGYRGLINNNIKEATWESVIGIIHKGGTIIGTARSPEFMTQSGRLTAAKNLITRQINHLIIIGGDGSLTGASILKNEWSSHVKELLAKGEITQEQANRSEYLKVVGVVATIDGDFPATDITLGSDTAMRRITDAMDAIATTALSHRRTFVLEVMGRNCGYLALKSAIISEADYLFIPEYPPSEGWLNRLLKKINLGISKEKELHIIIVAEGAIDEKGHPIKAEQIKDMLVDGKKDLDCRVTVLGHVQRGGRTTVFDRLLGARFGIAAVALLLTLEPQDDPFVVVLRGNIIKKISLDVAIQQVNDVKKALAKKSYTDVIKLRGRVFSSNFDTWNTLRYLKEPLEKSLDPKYRYAVLTAGSPACGMNACLFALVRACINNGSRIYGIKDGMQGFQKGDFKELQWDEVDGLVQEGGSILGTKLIRPIGEDFPLYARSLEKFGINGLFIIGGFHAFIFANELWCRRSEYPQFCIPIAIIPATIDNNVPGTDFSIGSDTALNALTLGCDILLQSARSTYNRVFIVETKGDFCGYLCTIAGIASGAYAAYIHEKRFNIGHLINDFLSVKLTMQKGDPPRGLILRSEKSNDTYTLDFITRMYTEEGKECFSTRKNTLGNLQEGSSPSAFDRKLAIKLALSAVSWMDKQFEKFSQDAKRCDNPESVVVIGATIFFEKTTSLKQLLPTVSFECRHCKHPWWMKLQPFIGKLSFHTCVFGKEHKDARKNLSALLGSEFRTCTI